MKVSVIVSLFASVAFASRLAPVISEGDVIADEYIVQLLEPEMSIMSSDAYVDEHLARAFGESVAPRNIEKLTFSYAMTLTQDEIDLLRSMPEVDFIEQNQKFSINMPIEVKATETQTNPSSWGLDRISHRDLPLAREYVYPSSAGEGVDVYIVDTGINTDHVDFEGRAKFAFTSFPGDQGDGNGHGTHVASTTCGKLYGVAKKANVFAVKVLSSQGYGSTVGVIKGVDFVGVKHAENAKKRKTKSVANMSLGGGKSNALEMAVTRAVQMGVMFAVAAGNENQDACKVSPAGAAAPLTVASSDRYDGRSYFSNWGKCADLFAPGSDITGAWIGSTTVVKTISGTSMASPHVCGVMALVLADNDFTTNELKAFVLKIATPDDIKDVRGTPNLMLFNNVSA